MLRLEICKQIFTAAGLIGIILFALPSLAMFMPLPPREEFSELYVLGAEHAAGAYPFNVRAGEDYLVYIGVGNHLGGPAYYGVRVKFRSEKEPMPNATAGTPSPLPTLYEFHVFLDDNEAWEEPLAFSFLDIAVSENASSVGWITINNATRHVDKMSGWNVEENGYLYQIFMELWLYNATADMFQFHNRFVGVWLNVTATV